MQSLPFDMIELNRSFKTKEEAIRYCGQMLVEAGCVDEEYIDAMVDRDKMLSVYMGNFIAIPHGTDEAKKYVKKSGICVVQVPDGVDLVPKKKKRLRLFCSVLQESEMSICNLYSKSHFIAVIWTMLSS